MKTLATILSVTILWAFSVPAFAGVTQAVFGIASSAKTSTANLRVQPMTMRTVGRDDNGQIMQTFIRQAGTTQNLFLTGTTGVAGHSQTVTGLDTALCLYIEVDQDTKMYLNSETAYILLPSGTREVQCFK